MILNYIWISFFIIGFIVALIRFTGYFFHDFFLQALNLVFDQADRDIFQTIIQNIFQSAKTSVEISIYLIGVMTLWLGIMKIGEKGGAVNGMSRLVGPFFNRLFPGLPKNHPVMGSMLMNFCANMLGLDNAATPLGLKAMKELQELNSEKDTASNSMIMFLVLNTAGMTILPISIIAMRAACGAMNPTDVFIPLLIATYCATIVGMIYVSIVQKINFFQPVILAYVFGITALITGLIFYLQSLPPEKVSVFSGITGNMLLLLVIILFLFMGIRKKVNLYDTFIEGAKEGFTVAVKIIPYLVAMLVAIGVFRASGAMDFLLLGLGKFFALFGFDTEFVKALPVALMKPLSGGGARGLMVETMKTYGADSFPGFLACIFQGSTETTFYVIAVYFGSVNIRKTRYAVTGGLIADLAGALVAIFVAYLFYMG
jgi:spore maturation protein SpmA